MFKTTRVLPKNVFNDITQIEYKDCASCLSSVNGANPITHYRRGYGNNCHVSGNRNVEVVEVVKENYNYNEHCDSKTCHIETKALMRVRNSGNKTSTATIGGSDYLKRKKMRYEDKRVLTRNSNTDTTNEFTCGDVPCGNNTTGSCKTYYKPSNTYCHKDGGVDSSTYLNKVKYNTIQSSAKSFEKTFGQSAAVAHAYPGKSQQLFTLGFKRSPIMGCNQLRRGNKQSCN